MKLLLIGSALLSGGSAVAMENETINETVTHVYTQAKSMVQSGFKGSMIDVVKETGFPYPKDVFLEQLTEEQEAIYLGTIDQINVEYDWSSMTDDEIQAALQLVKVELTALREELGIEAPQIQTRTQSKKGNHWNEDFVPNGDNSGTRNCPNNEAIDDSVLPDAV